MDNDAQTTEIGTRITYLTDSYTIKISGIGPIPLQMPELGVALLLSIVIISLIKIAL